MISFLRNIVRNERGVTAVEYGLIAALMAAMLVAAVPLVSKAISGSFTSIQGDLNSASTIAN